MRLLWLAHSIRITLCFFCGFLFRPVSLGSWPGGAWVPWRAETLWLTRSHGPQGSFGEKKERLVPLGSAPWGGTLSTTPDVHWTISVESWVDHFAYHDFGLSICGGGLCVVLERATRVKLTSERPRLYPWGGWGGWGWGPPVCVPVVVRVSLSLLFLSLSSRLSPPSLLSNPGETLIWPGWQSPSGFGPRRARHGNSGEEWGWRSRTNDPYEGGPSKYSSQLLIDGERGAESGSMYFVQLLLAMQGLWSHETATLWLA